VTYTRGRLVIAQEDVEAWLLLLDQVVLKRQRLFLVVYDDVLDVYRLTEQAPGFSVLVRALHEVRPHPGTQALRFADVDHFSLGVLVQVHAGSGGEGADFLVEIHEKR
jgi:hypothetical protein